jgi:Fic family protein
MHFYFWVRVRKEIQEKMVRNLSKLSLKQREGLFRQLRVSITHHSNAIEGTTLSFGETRELLELGHTAGHKPLGEQLVILGFAKAYDVVVREATNPNTIIDSSFVKDLHAILFEDALQVASDYVSKPIGAYRLDERYIKGVEIELASPSRIAGEMENLLYRFKSNAMSLRDMAEFHILFERIHPFADGNGRIGRLLMAYQAIQNDIIPPLIENESRDQYLQALNSTDDLSTFLETSITKSLELLSD